MADLPSRYTKTDLAEFRRLADKDFPALVPLIVDYIDLAEKSESDVIPGLPAKKPGKRVTNSDNMHLFDLLRDKRLLHQTTVERFQPEDKQILLNAMPAPARRVRAGLS